MLYPLGAARDFTDRTRPDSRLYGNRPSGLSITGIRVEGGECRFELEIAGSPKVGWTTTPRDRVVAGDFLGTPASFGEQLVVRSDDALAIVAEQEAQFVVVARADGWVGDWNLGADDRALSADMDGDGKDELFVRSPNWAGVLGWRSSALKSLTVQEDWVGEWNLGSDNRELAGDFDGDGRDEIYVRSPDWAGLLALEGGRLVSKSVQHDWIGQWNLGPHDTECVGRFSRRDRDQVLLISPDWLGLATWKNGGFNVPPPQHDWIDGWNLGADNKFLAADLDGDGYDEVYVRSPQWAGVLKWRDGAFRVLWMIESTIAHTWDTDPNHQLPLKAGDRSVTCRLLPDRDGIVHLGAAGRVAALTWEGGALRMRHFLDSPLEGRWPLSAADRAVAGRFQRTGANAAVPLGILSDRTEKVFLLGTGGTAAIGANFVANPQDGDLWQFGLSWVSGTHLMRAPRLGRLRLLPSEVGMLTAKLAPGVEIREIPKPTKLPKTTGIPRTSISPVGQGDNS